MGMDIMIKKPANSHTLSSLLKQYQVECRYKSKKAKKMRKELKKLTADCVKYQDQTLMAILDNQKDTEYGQLYKFSEIKSREEFVKRHPLTTYPHYADYVERMANGEENILTKDKVVFFGLSSGTTGKNKMYPVTMNSSIFVSTELFETRVHYFKTMDAAKDLTRELEFRIHHPLTQLPGGCMSGGVGVFFWRQCPYSLVPEVANAIHKTEEAFYVQGLFALAEPELGTILGFSSDLMLGFFKYLDTNWQAMCDDIENGRVRPHGGIPEKVLQELNKVMKANPKRAKDLRSSFQFASKGKALRIWPSLSMVYMAKTGSFAHSAQILKESYLDNVLIMFTMHGGTEGLVGFMMEDNPAADIYTFIPNCVFLEFIPADKMEDEDPPCYFIDQVIMIFYILIIIFTILSKILKFHIMYAFKKQMINIHNN